MQVIVGLGNPGRKYERTRHNVGRWVLAALILGSDSKWEDWVAFDWTRSGKSIKGCRETKVTIAQNSVALLVPESFMNLSGEGVGNYLRFFGIPATEMLVVYDELDLRPGVMRLKQGGSAGGHRGVESILSHLDSPEFIRLRLGIGHPRDVQSAMDVPSWVLAEPAPSERLLLESAVREATNAIGTLLQSGLEAAQTKFHKQNQ